MRKTVKTTITKKKSKFLFRHFDVSIHLMHRVVLFHGL